MIKTISIRRCLSQWMFGISIAISVFLSTTAFGQGTQSVRSEQAVSQLTHEVSNEILSPFCPGKSLAMCPSPAAADARRTIQKLAEKGLSKEQIKDELIEQYGDEFRRIIPGTDDNLVVLVIILIGGILCALFVWLLTRNKSNTSESPDSENIDPTTMSTVDFDDPDASNDSWNGKSSHLPTDNFEPDEYLDTLRDEYQN